MIENSSRSGRCWAEVTAVNGKYYSSAALCFRLAQKGLHAASPNHVFLTSALCQEQKLLTRLNFSMYICIANLKLILPANNGHATKWVNSQVRGYSRQNQYQPAKSPVSNTHLNSASKPWNSRNVLPVNSVFMNHSFIPGAASWKMHIPLPNVSRICLLRLPASNGNWRSRQAKTTGKCHCSHGPWRTMDY